MTEPQYGDNAGLGDEWEVPVGSSYNWPYDGTRLVTVRGARFAASTFDDNNTLLILDCLVDDENIPEKEIEYKVGKVNPDGYESLDGETLQRGKSGFGNKNNFYGKFVFDVTNRIDGNFPDLVQWIKSNGGSPYKASTWVGHTFLMEGKEFSFGPNTNPAIRAWPVEYIGHGPDHAVTVGTAGQEAAPVAAAATTTAADPTPAAAGGGIEDQLRELAAQIDTYDAFKSAAGGLGISDATVLVKVLTDASYYEELRASA